LRAVAAVALGTIHFQLGDRGIGVVDAIPPAMPHAVLPLDRIGDATRLLPLALIVALVCMMQTATVLRAFPSHEEGPRHVPRDFGGVGAGNILAGMFDGLDHARSP